LASIEAFPEFNPRVWVVGNTQGLLGVAPLAIHRETQYLRFPADLADYQDFIVNPNDSQSTRDLLTAVLADQGGASAIELRGLHPDSNIAAAIPAHGAADQSLPCVTLDQSSHPCYYTDLRKGYEAFLKTRSKKFLYHLRKSRQAAEASGVETTELMPDQISGDDVVRHFLRLHLLRFPDKLFSRPGPQRFCRRVLPGLFAQRVLRVFALIYQTDIIGIHLSMQDVRGLGIWNGGFDPYWAAISPGRLLISKQMEVCGEEGLAEYDFLRGNEDYKKSWSTRVRRLGCFVRSHRSSLLPSAASRTLSKQDSKASGVISAT
jgi:CelD/BcsL family acetyltransferase involved in cellulose biosynthesis